MNQKWIGFFLIFIGILALVFLFYGKEREDTYIREIMEHNNGSCFLEDGTCLHADRVFTTYLLAGIISATLAILGIYLIFFDNTQRLLAEHQVLVSSALEEAKKHEKEKDEYSAFLTGFAEDEQKVLKAIKEQDGIQQSTLRFRTGLSKTAISLMLKSFQEKGIITKQEAGKTNKIFLVKRF